MSKNKSASLEARIKNSKDLVVTVKNLTLYNPSSEDIKPANYEEFVNAVDAGITGYKSAAAELNAANDTLKLSFEKMEKVCRNVRSEIAEVKGIGSVEYNRVNILIKVILGENVTEHSRMKNTVIKNLKEGDPQPQFSSVSALDFKSRLGNFRSLIGTIKTFGFYEPTDSSISVTSLESLEAETADNLEKTALREIKFAGERSRIMHYFESGHGLKDRASRAKRHIRRKYGAASPEYKITSNKKY